MLLFDKKFDINSNIKKSIENVSKEYIVFRYNNTFITLNNPKILIEITKQNFNYNNKDEKYDLTLSKFTDLNMMNVVNNLLIYLDRIDDINIDIKNIRFNDKYKRYEISLYDDVCTNTSTLIYKIPLFVADILSMLQDFSISKRW